MTQQDAFADQLFRAWLKARMGDKTVYTRWENLPPDIRDAWLAVREVALAWREPADRKKL